MRCCVRDIDRLRGRIEVNVGSAIDAHRIFIRPRGPSPASIRYGPLKWRSPPP